MTEIKIHQNITPNKINDLYRKYILHENLGNVSLIIPGEFNKYRFGLLADLLKFVITLNNNSLISTLKIDIDKESIDSFYDQEYAYPVISLLWNTSKFLDKSNNDIKEILRFKQNDYFKKMNSLQSLKGRKYILSNTDHLSKNNGLIKFLENSDGFNDDEDYIIDNIKRILNEHVLIFNKQNSAELKSIIEEIGGIIFELTKNTYEWGKTDANMITIPTSIRGVYFRFHNNSIDKIIEEFDNTPIKDFFHHNYINEYCINELNRVYYLEILVYDSGIGYIERFIDRGTLSDIDIIKKCLIKNQTSSTSNLKSKKGLGLDRILNIMDKKGFVRISTDKYCVYRDLIKDNYKLTPIEELENLKLEDWNKNNFTSNNQIKSQGSFISILYPFKSNI
ncbi:hypothetical protein [Flavobacterium oreochromis]|uniref:hypothetical protein n=1 Tax=Flavobacterium oreochromis TaxID=2906078 RepID=UPI0038595783